MDLYIAARTDAELRAALFPVLMVHRGNLLTEAERLFPMAAQKNPRFALCVDGLMAILQGAAMSAAVAPQVAEQIDILPHLEILCRQQLEGPFEEDV